MNVPGQRQKMTSPDNGMALVLVLWILALLTIMAAGYSVLTRTETKSASNQLQLAEARLLAEAGSWIAIQSLVNEEVARTQSYEREVSTYFIGEREISVQVQNLAGKIDLNTAPLPLLLRLFNAATEDDEQAQRLSQSVLDWRDEDSLVHLDGAEDAEYFAAGRDYGAKDGPFNSVEELRLVQGITEDIYQFVSPFVTVHSNLETINTELASDSLLALLGLVRDEQPNATALARPNAPPGLAPATEQNRPATNFSPAFEILSVARIGDTGFQNVVTVSLSQGQEYPFILLSWAGTSFKQDFVQIEKIN